MDSNDDFDTENGFQDFYTDDAVVARAIVNRAITDWNAVINDFNYDGDDDPATDNVFELNVQAGLLTVRGITALDGVSGNNAPTKATITLDDDGDGEGWFFDTTPLDDAEFTGIADTFSSSFVDTEAVAQSRRDDFYRTIVHEIGHALGITSSSLVAIGDMLTPLVHANGDPVNYLGLNNEAQLKRFESTLTAPEFGVTATFFGNHLYEGSAVYLLEGLGSIGVDPDPVTVFEEGSSTAITFEVHANELMNTGRTVPAGQNNPSNETVRQWISDLDIMILADAYGYTVTLPSDLNSAHASLDVHTGALLVQGLPGAVVDDIDITTTGTGNDEKIVVTVNGTTEEFLRSDVKQILIAKNGGADTVDVATSLIPLRKDIDYVVSSNEDAVDANLTDNVLDLDAVVPGNQVSLRGAIQNANGDTAATIYVPRSANAYVLDLVGNESNGDAVNDLDITSNVTIIGAGPGLTVIDASGLGSDASKTEDRIFDVGAGFSLDLSRVTLTGGDLGLATGDKTGGAIRVPGGKLTLTDSALIGNKARVGGALRVSQATAEVTVLRTLFTDNEAGDKGGAIYSGDQKSKMWIGESVFVNNSATTQPNVKWETTTIDIGNNLYDSDDGFFSGDDDQEAPTGSYHVVSSVGDLSINAADDATRFSLREAVIAANADNGTILVPAWHFELTATGTEATNSANETVNDLDITGDVTLIGVGPGLTVIDASGLGSDNGPSGSNANEDRAFQLITSGSELDISRVTITGGDVKGTNASAGAIYVMGGNATLTASVVAFVDNHVEDQGGAIRVMGGGNTATITASVFTENSANDGGAIWMQNSQIVKVGTSVFANNVSTGFEHVKNHLVMNLGNNITDNDQSTSTFPDGVFFNTGSSGSDYEGTVHYVVTSIADTYDHADDSYSLSLREAVDLANEKPNAIDPSNPNITIPDEIWLPAWEFVLGRARSRFSEVKTPTDEETDVAFSDMEVKESVNLRGISSILYGSTNIRWATSLLTAGSEAVETAEDKVFELMGDYNISGLVDAADYTTWRDTLGSTTDLRADGNDDGVIDQDDWQIWKDHFGNTLTISNMTVAGTSYDGDGNVLP